MKVFRWWKDIPVNADTVFTIVLPQEVTDEHTNFNEVVEIVQKEKYFQWEIISLQKAVIESSKKQELFDGTLQALTAVAQTAVEEAGGGKALCEDFRAAMKIAS